jgi:hypothetical protein
VAESGIFVAKTKYVMRWKLERDRTESVHPSRGRDNWAIDNLKPDAGAERGSCCSSRSNFEKMRQANKDCDESRRGLQKTGQGLSQERDSSRGPGAARAVTAARGKYQGGAATRQGPWLPWACWTTRNEPQAVGRGMGFQLEPGWQRARVSAW